MPVYKNYIFRTTNEKDTRYIYNYLGGLGYKTNEILDNNYDEWNYYILIKLTEKYCVAGSRHSEQDVIDVINKNYPNTYMRIYDMDSLDIFKKLVDFSNRPTYEPRKILKESVETNRQSLRDGKYDILIFTIKKGDMDKAYEVKDFLRKLGIDKYQILNNHELWSNDDIYVIFTKKPLGTHEAFTLMTFGDYMIYDFFEEFYPEFNCPSPIMTADEFMDYVKQTVFMKAKLMYSPKKMNRDI